MINNQAQINPAQIMKLARNTLYNGRLNKKVVKFALSNLTRKELISYLYKVRKVVYDNSVRIISSQELSSKIQKSLALKFKPRGIFFEEDKSIGPGIKIIKDDTIIDLTFKGYMTNAIEQLKT